MKKNDILLIISILVIALLAIGAGKLFFEQEGAVAVVSVAGVETARYPLNQDTEVTVAGKDGKGSNRLSIHDGMADMLDADCPDKLCVHQKSISKGGETIVCLPHQIVVSVESEETQTLDAIAN